MRSIKCWIGRRFLNLGWKWAIKKGPGEPVTMIDGRQISWKIVEPKRWDEKQNDYDWDPTIYHKGNIYSARHCNPIEVVPSEVEQPALENDDPEDARMLFPSTLYRAKMEEISTEAVYTTGLRKLVKVVLLGLVLTAIMLGAILFVLIDMGAFG